MTEREKLIELMGQIQDYGEKETDFTTHIRTNERIADYLLANGVLVPPCKVGDDIWWVDEEKNDIACEKGGIKAVVYNGKTFEVLTEAGVEPIGTKYCNLSREEAEVALKGGEG